MRKIELEPYLFIIEDFLTKQECDDLILWSEEKGYEEAKVQVHGKQIMLKHVRNNSRITFIDVEFADNIWVKFKPFAIEKIANSEAIGLNEMFRFYKYENGQRFKKHLDGSYIRNEVESSYFTLMVYLNDGYQGGETTFENHTIFPKKGNALVFYHGMKHAGEEIKSGVKYVLRTDVMYKLIQ
jgi:prolyl 4-hydroxylase